jgi:hypothetical protein
MVGEDLSEGQTGVSAEHAENFAPEQGIKNNEPVKG